MTMLNLTIFSIVLISSLLSMVSATPGSATFYTSYVPSACYGSTSEGVWIAAAGEALWQGGAICGKSFKVSCTGSSTVPKNPCKGGSVTVKIVDHCAGCSHTFDLSKEAFSTIADPIAGIINVDYQQA